MTTVPFDAVAFDMDGTITDSEQTCLIALQEALQLSGVGPASLDALRPIVALPLVTSVPDLLVSFGATHVAVDDVVAAHEQCLPRVSREHTVAVPGIEILLKELHGRLPLAVVTSQDTPTAHDVLGHTGLGDYFVAIVGSDLTTTLKPTAAPLLEVCRQLDVAPDRVAVVGDATVDMLMATAAGAVGIGVDWGASSTDDLMAAGASSVVCNPEMLRDALLTFGDAAELQGA